jgi:hypothetical protein
VCNANCVHQGLQLLSVNECHSLVLFLRTTPQSAVPLQSVRAARPIVHLHLGGRKDKLRLRKLVIFEMPVNRAVLGLLLYGASVSSALYFHVVEGQQRCFIEEVPGDTLIVGNYKNPDFVPFGTASFTGVVRRLVGTLAI